MGEIILNKLDVARAAAAAYREGRLSAQGRTPECRYRDASGCPCAIGAAIDDATAAAWDSRSANGPMTASSIFKIHADGAFVTDDIDAICRMQAVHDGWSQEIDEEKDFVAILNDILPPEERIEVRSAADQALGESR